MARIDLYRNVHKGQRALLFGLAIELGRADCGDEAALAALVDRVRGAIADIRSHADHEETFIHPLLRARAPQIAAALDREHRQVDAALSDLESRLGRLDALQEDRYAASLDLYRAWCRMVSSYLAHLDVEECLAMPAVWETCTDDEILAVIGQFVASRSTADQLGDLRSQAPALTPHERAIYVGSVVRGCALPAERIWEGLAGVLAPDDLARLRAHPAVA
jgi:hypothetical protein